MLTAASARAMAAPSAVVSGWPLRAATSCAVGCVPCWKGAASWAARTLGESAGKKALLLLSDTLERLGRMRGMSSAATTQAATIG